MDKRRIAVVLVLFIAAPMAIVTFTTATANPPSADWAIPLGVFCGTICFITAIIVGSGQMGQRALAATKASLPGGLFVYRAMTNKWLRGESGYSPPTDRGWRSAAAAARN